MRQASCVEMIRCALRDHYDAMLTEPLPRRWVDLINSLDQQERDTRGLDRDHASETSVETEGGSAFMHSPKGWRSCLPGQDFTRFHPQALAAMIPLFRTLGHFGGIAWRLLHSCR